MRDELEQDLCTKYPKIFRDRNAPAHESPMSMGIECGDGWYGIIDRLCSIIQTHVDGKRHAHGSLSDHDFDLQHQTIAAQVKEKFGGLRFYADNADDYINGAISMAESLSYITCEACGARGARRGGAWIRTLCDEHTGHRG